MIPIVCQQLRVNILFISVMLKRWQIWQGLLPYGLLAGGIYIFKLVCNIYDPTHATASTILNGPCFIGVYRHGGYCIQLGYWGRRREPYLSSIGQQFSESVHSAEDDVVPSCGRVNGEKQDAISASVSHCQWKAREKEASENFELGYSRRPVTYRNRACRSSPATI